MGVVWRGYEKLVLDINQTTKLKVTGMSGNVKWQSSNKSVATVSKNGTITGRCYGTAVITASIAKKTFKCNVKVTYTIPMEAYEHLDHFSADYMSTFPLVLLDMNSTFDDFKSVGYKITGIYGAVYSEKKIYIEGFDNKGKSLGIHENLGLSYLEFDKAVNLRIMNPDGILHTLDFLPAKPTIIDKIGDYKYKDFQWYTLKDGNIQAPLIFAIENSYLEFVPDEEKDKKNNNNVVINAGYTPHFTGHEFDPEDMGSWKIGHITAIDKENTENLTDLWIYVDGYKVYIDEEDFYVYGKTGLDLPDNFKEMVYSYRDAVKEVASKYYLSDKDIWDKPYRIRFTYKVRSSAGQNHMSMNINDGSEVYYHEMAHYYHLDKMDYGCQIHAWTEGLATALAEDTVKLYDVDTTKAYVPYFLENGISEAELEDFENYFLNVWSNDCYTIGYYFIRFIQKEYGKSIVLEINDNIKSIPKPNEPGISPSNRNESSDKMFLDAIKKATSEDVFTRFVNEDFILRMKELPQIIGGSSYSLNRDNNIEAA